MCRAGNPREPRDAITVKTCQFVQRYAETPCTSEATPLMVADRFTFSIGSTMGLHKRDIGTELPRSFAECYTAAQSWRITRLRDQM